MCELFTCENTGQYERLVGCLVSLTSTTGLTHWRRVRSSTADTRGRRRAGTGNQSGLTTAGPEHSYVAVVGA